MAVPEVQKTADSHMRICHLWTRCMRMPAVIVMTIFESDKLGRRENWRNENIGDRC